MRPRALFPGRGVIVLPAHTVRTKATRADPRDAVKGPLSRPQFRRFAR
jgi:hypothetical protein